MRTFVLAILFQPQLGRTFGHTNARAVVSTVALTAFKPDILPFTFLFSHKIRPNQAGLTVSGDPFIKHAYINRHLSGVSRPACDTRRIKTIVFLYI